MNFCNISFTIYKSFLVIVVYRYVNLTHKLLPSVHCSRKLYIVIIEKYFICNLSLFSVFHWNNIFSFIFKLLAVLSIVLIKLLMPSYNDTTVDIEAADDYDLLTAFILSKIVPQIHVNETNTNSSSNRFYSNNWPFSFVYG